jgi:hypothetical protein
MRVKELVVLAPAQGPESIISDSFDRFAAARGAEGAELSDGENGTFLPDERLGLREGTMLIHRVLRGIVYQTSRHSTEPSLKK